jgi:poly(A) polymerase
VIDSSGLGLADLASKRIRLREDVDRGRVLSDDPLRILRLFRFQAQLGFQVDDALRPIVQANLGRLQILSGQRVRDELHKMFQCNDSHVALESLMEWGVIAEILPELLAMRGCEQDARYHSEGDVWVHTLRVMAEAPKTICQQWTALLHDVGKPATQSRLGDRIRFIGHEKVSHQMAQPIFERLFLPADLQNSVLQLIDLHLRGGDATQWTSAKPARKLMRDAGPLLDDLLQFIAADSRASLGPDLKPRLDHLNELDRWVSEAKSLGVPKTKALLNGNELMQLAQRGQGAWIAELSRALIEWEESLIQQQRAPTKEEAVVFARAWIEKQNSI